LIEESVIKTKAGSILVAQAGATMNEIVECVKRVTNIMRCVANASQQQHVDIRHITMNWWPVRREPQQKLSRWSCPQCLQRPRTKVWTIECSASTVSIAYAGRRIFCQLSKK
jgi:hypothetical protein